MAAAEKIKNSWEIRSIIFIARVFAVLFFLIYLCLTIPSAWEWGKLRWIRSQPLDAVVTVAEKSIAGNPENLSEWIGYRPSSDRPAIMEKLEPYSGKISSSIFLLYSRWTMEMGQEKEAVFWRQYARYRLRFDALRCGSPEATEHMADILAGSPDKRVQTIIEKDPSLLKWSLQRVLEFDAKHPMENNPIDICPALQKLERGNFRMVEQKNWRSIRHTLRFMTEYAIGRMDQNPKQ